MLLDVCEPVAIVGGEQMPVRSRIKFRFALRLADVSNITPVDHRCFNDLIFGYVTELLFTLRAIVAGVTLHLADSTRLFAFLFTTDVYLLTIETSILLFTRRVTKLSIDDIS